MRAEQWLFIAEGLGVNIATGLAAMFFPHGFLLQLAPPSLHSQVNSGNDFLFHLSFMFGLCMISLGLLEAVVFAYGTPNLRRTALCTLLFGDLLHGLWALRIYGTHGGDLTQILANFVPMISLVLVRAYFIFNGEAATSIAAKVKKIEGSVKNQLQKLAK
jgi:hypothetical protein